MIIPSICFIPVIFLFSLFYDGGNIFIENTISENFDAKIIYKQGDYVFHEESTVIAPRKTQKIVVPSGFSEGQISIKVSQNNASTEFSYYIDELYFRPPNMQIILTKENGKLILKTKSP